MIWGIAAVNKSDFIKKIGAHNVRKAKLCKWIVYIDRVEVKLLIQKLSKCKNIRVRYALEGKNEDKSV